MNKDKLPDFKIYSKAIVIWYCNDRLVERRELNNRPTWLTFNKGTKEIHEGKDIFL